MHAHHPPPPQPHDNHGGAPVPMPVLHHPVAPPFFPPQQHHHHQHHRSLSVADSQSGSLSRSTSQWSTGLCHCFDDPANCIVTGLCPCITFGQIAEIVNRGQATCIFNGTIIYGLLAFTGMACLYSCSYRSKLRTQYDLKEYPLPDCLVHFFCETCALCQEYRVLKMKGFDMSIGWDANVKRQGYGITTAPSVVGGMIR